MTEQGGAAFPHGNPGVCNQEGMTLRDYFAGQALLGLVGCRRGVSCEIVAVEAYKFADAMINEYTRGKFE